MSVPEIVSRDEWLVARKQLLVEENVRARPTSQRELGYARSDPLTSAAPTMLAAAEPAPSIASVLLAV